MKKGAPVLLKTQINEGVLQRLLESGYMKTEK